jgi:magnesium transporter
MSYEEGSVGALMDFDQLTVRPGRNARRVTKYLRALDELPGQSDQLFVVDQEQRLQGTLPLARLIVSDLERAVGQVMVPEGVQFHPEQKPRMRRRRSSAMTSCRRPVTDHFGRLIGRLTVNAVDGLHPREERPGAARRSRLREEEDVFASVWNRFATAGRGSRSTWSPRSSRRA